MFNTSHDDSPDDGRFASSNGMGGSLDSGSSFSQENFPTREPSIEVAELNLRAEQLPQIDPYDTAEAQIIDQARRPTPVFRPDDASPVSTEKLSLVHRAFRSVCHGFNDMALWCSELVFTGHRSGRIACATCTGFGWAVPPEVYAQNPTVGLFVAAGALSGAIASSAVNRAIHYNPLLIGEEGIADHIRAQGLNRFRESLSIAGLVAGPASFWASISPVLSQGRQQLIAACGGAEYFSPTFLNAVDYLTGRVEHLVPFLLIGAITTMKIVNQDPERFIRSMSPTAGLISPLFSWWAGLREMVSKEFTDSEK